MVTECNWRLQKMLVTRWVDKSHTLTFEPRVVQQLS